MEFSRNLQIIFFISFMDTFCSGLFAPVFSPHIMALGGNHVLVAIMISGGFICQSLAKDFIALVEHRKKCTLIFSLTIILLSYMIIALTTSPWIAIFCKFSSTLANRIHDTVRGFIRHTETFDVQERLCKIADILNVAGLVLGPVIGGYVRQYGKTFFFNGFLASLLIFSCLLLLPYLEQDDRIQKPSFDFAPPSYYVAQIKSLKAIDYKRNWDKVLLKTAYTASFTIFFTKYPLLLNYNYSIGNILLGYAMAYQHMLIFTVNVYFPRMRHHASASLTNLSLSRNLTRSLVNLRENTFEPALLVCSVTLAALYYAPSFDCYLIIFIPMIVTHIMVENFWDDSIEVEVDGELYNTEMVITTIVKIVVPIIFGLISQFFGAKAFKIFAVLPMVACVYVLNRRFIKPRGDEDEDENKED